MTYLPGPITPATANQLRWQVNWRATPLRHTYTFAGQHTAQRQGKTFTYLHTDHLGSTLLATDQTGAVVGGNQPRYAAYGRERMPTVAALPTEYTFTGQKQDGTGLIYMSARYYDPQLGTFISPDSLMPDPTSLADYNRYLYAHGNPMQYTDLNGHCATLPSGASDDNDSECWRLANTIANSYDNTTYWQKRYGSQDNFVKYVASNGYNHADFFKEQMNAYGESDEYKAWDAQLKASWAQDWTLVPAVPTDAIVVGFSASGRLSFVGGTTGISGIEFLAHQNGKVALYTYGGIGGTVGEGANASVYVGVVKNLPDVNAYGHGFVGQTSATVSIGPLGATGGEFHDLLNPNGAHGSFIGYSPGAALSVDNAITYYTLPWAVYDFNTGGLTSSQIK